MHMSDLQSKEIIDISSGRRLGRIVDILVDTKGNITKLILDKKITKKILSTPKEDIEISWNKIIKIGDDIILVDSKNIMKGVLEDLIIDKETLSIKGMIMSSGIIDTMFKGKEIILASGCILCEKFILYKGKEYIKLKTLPHNLGGAV